MDASFRLSLGLLAAASLAIAGCGGDDDAGGDDASPSAITVEVPEGATFCSVFTDGYRPSIDAAVPFGDPEFTAAAGATLAWAHVLQDLAPAELAAQAEANVQYHLAQIEVRSASDFIPLSNELSEYGFENC